jgi:hypothetical protein
VGSASSRIREFGGAQKRGGPSMRRLLRWSLCVMPIILAVIYYGAVAADR